MVILLIKLILLSFWGNITPTIRIDSENDKEYNFVLSEFAESFKYVKLETSDDCMIESITKLLIDDENILILNRSSASYQILRFNLKGEFLNKIGNIGRGPGEYKTIHDFTLDRSMKVLYCLDVFDNTIHIFNYSGQNLKNFKINSTPTGILFANDNLYLFSAWPDYYLNHGYAVEIMPMRNNLPGRYLINREYISSQRGQGVLVYPNFFYGINNNKSISFFEEKFDTLYCIDSKNNLSAKFVFNLVNEVPRDILTTIDHNRALKKYHLLFDFIETEKNIFFSITSPKVLLYFYIFDKDTGTLRKHTTNSDKQYISNDIDGGYTFRPIGLANQNVLYSYVDCFKLRDYMNKKPGRHANDKELMELVKKSNYYDNPILMLVTLK